ncbi:MAG: cation diffusion facilitator family transporter [bacterium]
MGTSGAGQSRREVYEREVRRVTIAGLIVNLFLSAFKFVAGVLGHSQAVVADSVHSLSDSVTDVAILVGVRFWMAPADDDHPHGHGRIETVVTIFIGVLLVAVAAGLVWNALSTLSREHEHRPGIIALVAALVSIVSKELLYRWTVGVGRRIRSSAVVVNAWHHRSDGFSSIPAALAVGGAYVVPAWAFLDHVGAVVVSVFILQAAWRILKPAFGQLIDVAAGEEEIENIGKISASIKGVRHVHKIRTRYVGSCIEVDLHIEVERDMTVFEGHEIAGEVKYRLLAEGPDVCDVVVHIEPFKESSE